MSDTDKSWPSLKASLIITTTGAHCPTQLRQIVRRRHGPDSQLPLENLTLSPMTISWIAFACLFGGALLRMLLRRILPVHH
jgi:hypothetical protein